MNINTDILMLDENEVSILSPTKPEPVQDIGLTEQVVKSENPKLIGDDEIIITKSPFVIGKESTCSYAIKGDTYISRKHCRIVKKSDGYYIEDMESTNGTFVNGEKIKRMTKLIPGQTIKLADRSYIWSE